MTRDLNNSLVFDPGDRPLSETLSLVGRKVVAVRCMTDAEVLAEGWSADLSRPIVIIFDDGSKLFGSRDTNGTGPGPLFLLVPEDTEDGLRLWRKMIVQVTEGLEWKSCDKR